MLRRISRLGFFIQFLLFVAIGTLLWLPAFIQPQQPLRIVSEGPLYVLLVQVISWWPVIPTLVALLLTISLCLLLYYIGSVNDIHSRDNFLSAIFLLFFLSWNPALLLLHPLLPASLLLLFAIHTLMRIYGQQDPLRQVFSASLSIGIASLFYFPSVYLLLLIWFSFMTYRITTWREWIITLIGYLIPFVYLFSWYFWTDKLEIGLSNMLQSIEDPGLNLAGLSLIQYIWLAGLILILGISSFALVNLVQDRVISIRRKSFIMMNLIFACIPLIIISGAPLKESHQIFYVPLSFAITGVISLSKKSTFFEWFVVAFVILLLTLRFLV
ncbi:MAG: hypothetical protein IPH45_09090 [Bacteroidales bacterium]|nr:hypothetical protein [Bacteroidales bacterium]